MESILTQLSSLRFQVEELWKRGNNPLKTYESADKIHREALALAHRVALTEEKRICDYLMAEVSMLLARCCWQLCRYEDALKCAYSASSGFRRLGDSEYLAKSTNIIAVVYAELGDHLKALEYFHSCLSLSQTSGDVFYKALTLGNIGNIYYQLEDFDSALGYYERSLKLRHEVKDQRGVSVCLNNIGSVYVQQQRYPQALKVYEESIALKEEMGDTAGVAGTLSNIGSIYEKQGAVKTSIGYQKKALEQACLLGLKNAEVIALASLGRLYTMPGKEHHAEKATSYLQEAIATGNQLNIPREIKEAHRLLSDIYESTNEPELALSHYKEYMRLSEQLFTSGTLRKVENLRISYEVEQKMTEDELQQLKEVTLLNAQRKSEALEDELTQKDALLKTLLETDAAGIIQISSEGVVCDSNEKALELYGLQREDFVGKSIYDLATVNESYSVKSNWTQIKEGNINAYDETFYHETPDGTRRRLHAYIRAIRDASGNLTGVTSILLNESPNELRP
ncbi:MAG: tetratricopeptide repeat protein [Opitutales bacterium]|nr:tetratricopeptide repeat protein [Opitutales bacterium]